MYLLLLDDRLLCRRRALLPRFDVFEFVGVCRVHALALASTSSSLANEFATEETERACGFGLLTIAQSAAWASRPSHVFNKVGHVRDVSHDMSTGSEPLELPRCAPAWSECRFRGFAERIRVVILSLKRAGSAPQRGCPLCHATTLAPRGTFASSSRSC